MLRSPRIVFVLGKGGVGRSTVATALGLSAARRGERVLVFGWTLEDPIAPWFGMPPAGTTPVTIEPGLAVGTYTLDEALRAYFVDHLHLPRFHRHVVRASQVRSFIEAAPGLGELLFLGTLWWLTTLAPVEAGLEVDRIVVDAPATGHGASILDLPDTLAEMPAAGLLGREIERVTEMMQDPAWTGAVVVSTPEELAIEESADLLPRATRSLRRPPLAAFVNRAVGGPIVEAPSLAPLAARLSPENADAIDTIVAELRARAAGEARLMDLFARRTERDVVVLPDVLLERATASPREVVEALHEIAGGVL